MKDFFAKFTVVTIRSPMDYIRGENRRQLELYTPTLEDAVSAESSARVIDAFVDSLKLAELGFKRSKPQRTGRPAYDPKDLLKILVYGYFHDMKSSRKMAWGCTVNIEMMWLVKRLTPDFRTISDFRLENRGCMKKVFLEFNKVCCGLDLFERNFVSIDGSKFRACNAKDNNYTLSKLDDRLERIKEHIDAYLKALEENDKEEDGKEDPRRLSPDQIRANIAELEARQKEYTDMLKMMEEKGLSQVSMTDPDSKLMKCNDGFCVGYNQQVAVDGGSHLIAGFVTTNAPTDHGQLTPLAKEVKELYQTPVLESTADKGYNSPEDMTKALENGIVPNVIQGEHKDSVSVEFEYEGEDAASCNPESTDPAEITKCLRNGVIPRVYNGILDGMYLNETSKMTYEVADSDVLHMTDEQRKDLALRGYFVRDAEANFVYCPAGCKLRQKSVKRDGRIRYYNRLACTNCSKKCTASDFKEADFAKDCLLMRCMAENYKTKPEKTEDSGENETDKKPKIRRQKSCETKKKWVCLLHIDMEKTAQRMSLSEHPFGTVKRAYGSTYYNLRGKDKVEAEAALHFLSYNIRRSLSLCGVEKFLEALSA